MPITTGTTSGISITTSEEPYYSPPPGPSTLSLWLAQRANGAFYLFTDTVGSETLVYTYIGGGVNSVFIDPTSFWYDPVSGVVWTGDASTPVLYGTGALYLRLIESVNLTPYAAQGVRKVTGDTNYVYVLNPAQPSGGGSSPNYVLVISKSSSSVVGILNCASNANDFAPDGLGNIWVVAQGNGVEKFTASDIASAIAHFPTPQSPSGAFLSGVSTFSCCYDVTNNQVWVGTSGQSPNEQLYQLDASTGATLNTYNATGLSNFSNFNSLLYFNGFVWCSTNNASILQVVPNSFPTGVTSLQIPGAQTYDIYFDASTTTILVGDVASGVVNRVAATASPSVVSTIASPAAPGTVIAMYPAPATPPPTPPSLPKLWISAGYIQNNEYGTVLLYTDAVGSETFESYITGSPSLVQPQCFWFDSTTNTMWVGDDTSETLYGFDANSLAQTASIALDGPYVYGAWKITGDANNIYVVDFSGNDSNVAIVSKTAQTVVGVLTLESGFYCTDLTFDGAGNLWVTTNNENGGGDVEQFTASDIANAIANFPTAQSPSGGVFLSGTPLISITYDQPDNQIWVGTYTQTVNLGYEQLYQLDASTGATLNVLNVTGSLPISFSYFYGIVYYNGFVWCSTFANSFIQVTPSTFPGTVNYVALSNPDVDTIFPWPDSTTNTVLFGDDNSIEVTRVSATASPTVVSTIVPPYYASGGYVPAIAPLAAPPPPGAMEAYFITSDQNNDQVYVVGLVSSVHKVWVIDNTGAFIRSMNASTINLASVQDVIWVGADVGGNTDKLVYWLGGGDFATLETATATVATWSIGGIQSKYSAQFESYGLGNGDGPFGIGSDVVGIVGYGYGLIAYVQESFNYITDSNEGFGTPTLSYSSTLDPNGNPYVELYDPYNYYINYLMNLLRGAEISGWTVTWAPFPAGTPIHTYYVQSIVDANHILLWDTVIQSGDTGGSNYEYTVYSNGALLPLNNNGIPSITTYGSSSYYNSAWYVISYPIAGMFWNYASQGVALLRYGGYPTRPSEVGGQWHVDESVVVGIAPTSLVLNFRYATPENYPDQTGTRIPLAPAFGNASFPYLASAGGSNTTNGGAAASFTANGDGTATITGLTSVPSNAVGATIIVSNTTYSNDSGPFEITVWNSANSVNIFTGGNSSYADPNNGSIIWSITVVDNEYVWTLDTDSGGVNQWAETYSNFPNTARSESNIWSAAIDLSLPPLGYAYGDGTSVLWGINSLVGSYGTPYLMVNAGPVPRSGSSYDPTLAWTLLLNGSSSPDTSLAGQIPLPNAVTQLSLDVYSLENTGQPGIYMLGNDGHGNSILSYYIGSASTPPSITPNFSFTFSPASVSLGSSDSSAGFNIITAFTGFPDTITSFVIYSGGFAGAILSVAGLPAIAGTTLSATLYSTVGAAPGLYDIVIQGNGLAGTYQQSLLVLLTTSAEIVYDPIKWFEGYDFSNPPAYINAETVYDPIKWFEVWDYSNLPPNGFPAETIYDPIKFFEGQSSQRLIRYYYLRASNTTAPGGYIYWINRTGDNAGRPNRPGTTGPTFIVATWIALG